MAKPVFMYISKCCEAPATKPACASSNAPKLNLGDKPEGDSTLGTWRCTRCRKPCTCTRYVQKETVR